MQRFPNAYNHAMRRIAAVLLVTFALALPSLAATEPNASKKQRELILKLLGATDANSKSAAMIDGMFAQMEKQFAANTHDAEEAAEAKELFASIRRRTAAIDFPGIMNEEYVRMYGKYFSEEELAELLAFYESSIGKKSIEVMPQLMQEGMEAGARLLGPKINEIMIAAREEQEKKRPWRRTMSDIRSVAAAIEAYATDHDELYPHGDYEALKAILVPDYLSKFPEKDIWDHAYAYTASPDRTRYRLVSAGADGIFDWDSRTIPAAEPTGSAIVYRERLEDDVIFADGSFLQLPQQAKREMEAEE